MTVLVAGGMDTRNLGDIGTLSVLAKEADDDVVVLSRHPGKDSRMLWPEILNLDHARRSLSTGRFFHGFNHGDDYKHLNVIAEAMREAEEFWILGGRMFVEYTMELMRGHMPYFAELLKLARWVGTPARIRAASVPYPQTRKGTNLLRLCLSLCDSLEVREQASRRHCQLQVRRLPISVEPDPCYSLDRVEPHDHKQAAVGVAVRSYMWREGGEGQEALEWRLASLIAEVAREKKLYPVFIPQQTYRVDGQETDDRVVAGRVAAKLLSFGVGSHVIEEELSLEKALSMWGGCEMALSQRRHGLIFAKSQGVTQLRALPSEDNTYRAAGNFG